MINLTPDQQKFSNELDEMLASPEMSAYARGRIAYSNSQRNNTELPRNPYPEDCREHGRWDEGDIHTRDGKPGYA